MVGTLSHSSHNPGSARHPERGRPPGPEPSTRTQSCTPWGDRLELRAVSWCPRRIREEVQGNPPRVQRQKRVECAGNTGFPPPSYRCLLDVLPQGLLCLLTRPSPAWQALSARCSPRKGRSPRFLSCLRGRAPITAASYHHESGTWQTLGTNHLILPSPNSHADSVWLR